MFRFLILPYLVLEMIITYHFLHANGFVIFVIEVLASTILGLFLMTKRPMVNLANFARITPKYILSEFGFVAAGFALCVPLILSDILGICLLVAAVILYLKNPASKNDTFYRNSSDYSAQNSTHYRPKNHANDDIIDAEIIEEKKGE